jgi:hypothetical protein
MSSYSPISTSSAEIALADSVISDTVLLVIRAWSYIPTADEDALYLHGGELLELKAERNAEGNVVFSGQDAGVRWRINLILTSNNPTLNWQNQSVPINCRIYCVGSVDDACTFSRPVLYIIEFYHRANAVPNLKYAWVKGGELERGKVKVFIMNHDFEASAEEQAEDIV